MIEYFLTLFFLKKNDIADFYRTALSLRNEGQAKRSKEDLNDAYDIKNISALCK